MTVSWRARSIFMFQLPPLKLILAMSRTKLPRRGMISYWGSSECAVTVTEAPTLRRART